MIGRVSAALRLTAWAAVLVLAARFEYAAGQSVGLGDGWSYAVPVMTDAYAVSAVLAGRDVRAALSLLWVTMTTGALHRALTVDGAHADRAGWMVSQVVMAAIISTVSVLVLWRIDVMWQQDQAARAADAERARADAAAAELARADAAAERAAAERAHALEIARVRAETEQAHAAAERVAAERTHTERRARTRTPRTPRRDDDLERRRALRTEWETGGRTMTAADVAGRLGITQAAGRALLHRWAKDAPALAVGE